MDRNIVYPGAIPLDADILTLNVNTMVAIGYLISAVLGTGIAADGLSCGPTVPPSSSVSVGPGCLIQMSVVDSTPFGSLPSDTSGPLMKMGINKGSQSFNLSPPTNSGQSLCYLIQASFLESDEGLTVLSYFNATNPNQPYSGPANSGLPQATARTQSVQLSFKSGIPSATGTQLPPAPDNGWVGLYIVTLSYGQSVIADTDIAVHPSAPFIAWKVPDLRPGFGSGVQSFYTNGEFIVPAGVSQAEVELWGGGSGSYASTTAWPSGGGSGGGYAKKRITGLRAGQIVPVLVANGGAGGTVSGSLPGAGGTSSFGQFASATGGALNYLSTASIPIFGATPAGIGVNGDVNLTGSAGQASVLGQGGMGGGAPMSGAQNSGTTGVAGSFPGGGAAGAGTGANGATAYDGAEGGGGLVVVRW